MERRPSELPIGIVLSNAARDVHRAFDNALARAGGSRPAWLVLMSLKRTPMANQRELAAMIGIEGATLSHHLNAMEADGLITRRRDPANRRVHIVELTVRGEAAFHGMLGTVIAFDRRLRDGLSGDEIAELARLLDHLRGNVAAGDVAGPSAPGAATENVPSAKPVSAMEPTRQG